MAEDRQLVRLSRVGAVRIMAEGKAARRAGRTPLYCPYDPNGDATERVREAAWMRAYTRAG
jgi:hypothetical protein